MTLYLKYRPQKLSELDIVSVRDTLTSIVASSSLPHAFLFTGPRGTGKTSAARILAKALNCEQNTTPGEPCNECETCRAITACTHMDVIEMDAASNRGIDDIRSLKQEIMLAPSSSKHKIYIIDEAHMLTTEAANALLKTLEEPPAHVLFILATTDSHKLPVTILSRLSTVQFRKATPDEVIQKLKRIAESESLSVEPAVYELLANASDGAFRDAVKLLEELSLTQKQITAEVARGYLFGTQSAHPENLLTLLSQKNASEAIRSLEEMSLQGGSVKSYLTELISLLHRALLAHYKVETAETFGFTKEDTVQLLDLFISAAAKLNQSPEPIVPLLIAVVNFCSGTGAPPAEKKVVTLPTAKPAAIETAPPAIQPVVEPLIEKTDRTIPTSSVAELSGEVWTRLLSEIRAKNASVEAMLRAAHPTKFDGKKLEVGVYYRFHKERLEVHLHKHAFEEAAHAVFGSPITVSYELTDRPVNIPTENSEPSIVQSHTTAGLTMPQAPDIIEAAKEIFGN